MSEQQLHVLTGAFGFSGRYIAQRPLMLVIEFGL